MEVANHPLLKIVKGDLPASEGKIQNKNVSFGYVSQLIYEYKNLSGGEKFNRALSIAFSNHPDALLLDEPTNHLDLKNRRSLIKMMNLYKGTLIIVTHDTELLRNSIDILWHIYNGKYDDYRQTIIQERQNIENEFEFLIKEKKKKSQNLNDRSIVRKKKQGKR
jgi:ATPase subunit of ABC transporter with duplicated ATPase domains